MDKLTISTSEPLQSICVCGDAMHSQGGLSPVNKDVIETDIFNKDHWNLNKQIIDICKPLVDIIRNIESHDANLADCMVELIDAYWCILNLPIQDTYNTEFYNHTIHVLMKEFNSINSPLHWFALFLHPFCRNLAGSSATHSQMIDNVMWIGLDLASRFGWMEDVARKLTKNICTYGEGGIPFNGGAPNGLDWWKELLVKVSE